MTQVEVERQGVEELELLVAFDQMGLVDPPRGLGVGCERRLEPILARDFLRQHGVGLLRELIGHRNRGRVARPHPELGIAVAGVVQPPAMHARQQAAKCMPLLVEVGRIARGPRRARDRRGAEPARHAGGGVEHRRGIEVVPAAIVVADDVDHLVERIEGIEPVVAEGAREGAADIVVLGHRADEARLARRGALNHHDRDLLR